MKTKHTPRCKRRCLLFIEFSLYIIGIGALIQWFLVPHAIRSTFDTAVEETLIISSNTSDGYANWKENTCDDKCGIQLFNYYLFNTTNPDEVTNGLAYPNLTEIGPFIFNRYELKRDVIFTRDSNGNEIVNYRYDYEFVLNETLMDPEILKLWNHTTWINYYNASNITAPSYPTINMLNPFGLVILTMCREGKRCQGISCCQLMRNPTEGFSFHLFTGPLNPTFQILLQDGLHSNLAMLNDTKAYIDNSSNYVSEYTGQNNKNKMRELIYFGEINETQKTVPFWNGTIPITGCREPKQWPYKSLTSANAINNVWMMDKYRPVKLIKNGTMDISGVQVSKYIIDPKEYLAATGPKDANWKYYQLPYDGLIKLNLSDGILNITTSNGRDVLQYNSKPYFLDAPWYRDNVNSKMGLPMPNRTLHDTYFAVDAELGTTFESQAGIQISLGIYKCASTSILNQCGDYKNIQSMIVPQFYVVVHGIPPPALLAQYKEILELLDVTTQYSLYLAPAVAFACFVLAFYLSFKRICRCWKRKFKRPTMYIDDNFEEDPDAYSLANMEEECNTLNYSQNQTLIEEFESDNDSSENDTFAKRDEDQIDHSVIWSNTKYSGDKQTSSLLSDKKN
eukprot:72302_1